eukprot:235489-Chlamydomonas_euryale.AAC.2
MVRGRVTALDASDDPSTLSHLRSAFSVGQYVRAAVLPAAPSTPSTLSAPSTHSTPPAGAPARHLDLSLLPPARGTPPGSTPRVGSTLAGRVVAVTGGGLRVALPGRHTGTVALTDLHDRWVPNAVAGIAKGAYVRVKCWVVRPFVVLSRAACKFCCCTGWDLCLLHGSSTDDISRQSLHAIQASSQQHNTCCSLRTTMQQQQQRASGGEGGGDEENQQTGLKIKGAC